MTTMTTASTSLQSAWQDRWNQPDFDGLFKDYIPQVHKAINNLLNGLAAYEALDKSLVWYGPSWKWTVQYALDHEQAQVDDLCYIMPNHEGPQLCIPLTDSLIEHMPMRRFNKFIRHGIISSKKAVNIHWATWRITASSEVVLLLDLIKRKHKLLTVPPKK